MDNHDLNLTIECWNNQFCQLGEPSQLNLDLNTTDQVKTVSWRLINSSDQALDFVPLILHDDLASTVFLEPRRVNAHESDLLQWQFHWPSFWSQPEQVLEFNFDYIWVIEPSIDVSPAPIAESGKTINISHQTNHNHNYELAAALPSSSETSIPSAQSSATLASPSSNAAANSDTHADAGTDFASHQQPAASPLTGQVLGVGTQQPSQKSNSCPPLWWLSGFLLLPAALLLIFFVLKRRKKNHKD